MRLLQESRMNVVQTDLSFHDDLLRVVKLDPFLLLILIKTMILTWAQIPQCDRGGLKP